MPSLRPSRATLVAGSGLLVGLAGGWLAGLLRVPRTPLPPGAASAR